LKRDGKLTGSKKKGWKKKRDGVKAFEYRQNIPNTETGVMPGGCKKGSPVKFNALLRGGVRGDGKKKTKSVSEVEAITQGVSSAIRTRKKGKKIYGKRGRINFLNARGGGKGMTRGKNHAK